MRSFTLLELIIVIIILGIIATWSIPNFLKTKEHTLGKEAIANLKLITDAQKIYKMESNDNAYGACQCTVPTDCYSSTAPYGCNYLLKLSLNTQNWAYNIAASGISQDATFNATADRVGSGGWLDCQYSITNSLDEPQATTNCP